LLARAATATCFLKNILVPYGFFFADDVHVRVPVREFDAVAYTAAHHTVVQFGAGSMNARALASMQQHATAIADELGRSVTLADIYGSRCELRARQPFAALRSCGLTPGDIAAFVAVALTLFPALDLNWSLTMDAACDPSGKELCISDEDSLFAVNLADHRRRLHDLPRFAETDLLRLVVLRASYETTLLECVRDVWETVQHGVSVDMVHATDDDGVSREAETDEADDITLGAQGSTLVTDLVDLIVQHRRLKVHRRRR